MSPKPMKCYANMLSEYKVFLSNNFIGSKTLNPPMSAFSNSPLPVMLLPSRNLAIYQSLRAFLVSISSAYCKHQTSASIIHTISPNFQIQTFDQTPPQNLDLYAASKSLPNFSFKISTKLTPIRQHINISTPNNIKSE